MANRAPVVRTAVRDLVLADDAGATAAGARLAAGRMWPTAVALAGQWRVAPLVAARLPRLGISLDPASTAHLREMTLAAAAHRSLAIARSREGLQILARARVDAIAIKGIALVAGLYGPRTTRMVGDLDIIVHEGAYPAARTALGGAGYVDRYIAVDRHMADIADSPHLHNVARTLTCGDFEIDVHWQFGTRPPTALRASALIRRACDAPLGATTIRVAAPADAMSVSAHHALRGYFSPYEIVKDAADLAAWWMLKREAWRLDDVIETALAAEVATALFALWQLIASGNAEHPVHAGLTALDRALTPQARREARELTGFCMQQFEGGTRAERTVQLFDGLRLGRAFVAQTRKIATNACAGTNGAAQPARRPPVARVLYALGRIARVLRDLANVRAYAGYRAVARAQSRHH